MPFPYPYENISSITNFLLKISIMRHKKIKFSLEEGKSSKSQYLNCVSCVASIGSHKQVGTSDQPTAGPVAPLCVMTESWWTCCRHFINKSCFLKLLLYLTGFIITVAVRLGYLSQLSPIYLKEILAWRWLFLCQFSFFLSFFFFFFFFFVFAVVAVRVVMVLFVSEAFMFNIYNWKKMYLKIRKIKILP